MHANKHYNIGLENLKPMITMKISPIQPLPNIHATFEKKLKKGWKAPRSYFVGNSDNGEGSQYNMYS